MQNEKNIDKEKVLERTLDDGLLLSTIMNISNSQDKIYNNIAIDKYAFNKIFSSNSMTYFTDEQRELINDILNIINAKGLSIIDSHEVCLECVRKTYSGGLRQKINLSI